MARRKRPTPEAAPRTLAEAFPSSPTRPPKFGFYCHNEHGHFAYFNFAAAYAAKKFFEVVTDGTSFKWLNTATILADNGVRISTNTLPDPRVESDLEKIIEYNPTPAEREWQVPEPHYSNWLAFAATPRDTTPATPRPERRQSARRVEGNVTIAAIAQQLNIEPSKARAALRKTNEPKPPQGWEWPPTDVERIKATIREHVR